MTLAESLRRRSCFPAHLLILIAATLTACATDEPAPEVGPNIVLITIESLRPDHLSVYGYDKPTTPGLEHLAGEATLYENAYATTSWTLPSHASLFTGLHPSTHRVLSYTSRLDDSYTTIAEELNTAGYQTAGFVSGPLLRSPYNLDQGFEIYDASPSMESSPAAHSAVTNGEMERLLLRFLDTQRDPKRPFFLFAYLWDPHYDYIPPPPHDGRFVGPDAVPIDLRDYQTTSSPVVAGIAPGQLSYVLSQYDGEIGWTDAMLGRLWRRMEALELWDDAAIILTSDHGEEFFDHGGKGHKQTLYEESIHVPLIVKHPGQNDPRRDGRFTSLVDLHPTILEIAGLEPTQGVQGRSLLRNGGPVSGPIFAELHNEALGLSWHSVRDGDWKLHLERSEGTIWLFELGSDPDENVLAETRVNVARKLLGELAAHIQDAEEAAARWSESPALELSPEDAERLRSLGYTGE